MNSNNQEITQQLRSDRSDSKTSDSKSFRVKSLFEFALETLYTIDWYVESIKHEMPAKLVRSYEKYVANREKLKEEEIQKDKRIQIYNKIGQDLAIIGDEFMEIIHSGNRNIDYRQIVRIAGTLIHISYMFSEAVNNNLI